MALFGKKKEENNEAVAEQSVAQKASTKASSKKGAEKKPAKAGAVKKSPHDLSWVVQGPRITEKAALLSEKNAYTFSVHPSANKIQIKQAIKSIYKVTPVKVNISTLKKKPVRRRGRPGLKGGGKKAMVFVKEGESIDLM